MKKKQQKKIKITNDQIEAMSDKLAQFFFDFWQKRINNNEVKDYKDNSLLEKNNKKLSL